MKMLVDTDKMYKLALTPDGQLAINLSNGKTIQGSLTPEEQEVIAVAVTRISERVIEFEPKPNDYIALHLADIETLEKQALALEELRTELEAKKESLSKHVAAAAELQLAIEAANKELESTKPQLRDTSLVVQEQAAQLTQLRADLAATQQELNGVKGELMQSLEVVQKQREVITSASPAVVEIPAGEAPKAEAVSLPDNSSGSVLTEEKG